MSICIHENCDQMTVDLRPNEPKGALLLSQLYCKVHLEEASVVSNDDNLQIDSFALDSE